ncbi:MAG: Gfo/Idh/MocA family oxidoreductase, partial [OM182 bacterium]
MVGGGIGAFIGDVHRMAARLDDRYELVAGAFSSDPARTKESAAEFGVAEDRAYKDFTTMVREERARADGIEAVAIVTPNHLHHAPAREFLDAGIHVICDKPLTASLEDARELQALVKESDLLFAVTYNYSGYPMVRQAREMIGDGALGDIRVVQVEYPQDWLSTDLETSGQKQAAWRTDPKQAGAGGSIGDIGTHAFHLTEFVTGLEVTSLLADLHAFVPGRQLDDNAQMLLRFSNGARGSLWASQVAVGHENGLRIRVYGEQASLEWFQEQPNQLRYSVLGETPRV